jgi:hypothetical protein
MTINRTLPCSLFMLITVATFAANDTPELIMDGGPCLDLVRPIERLTCFEEQARVAQQRPAVSMPQQNLPVVSIPRNASSQSVQPAQQVQPQPAAETPQPAESARVITNGSLEANFGLPEERDKKAQANELTARVAEIKEFDRNRSLITLDNGQVWEQVNSKRFPLEEGDEVRVYSTRWGNSYRLASLSRKGFIQVQRLR